MIFKMDQKRVALALALLSAAALTGCGKKGSGGEPGGVGGIGGGLAGGTLCGTGQGYSHNGPIPFSGTVAIGGGVMSANQGQLQVGTQVPLPNPLTYRNRALTNGTLDIATASGIPSQSSIYGSPVPANGVLSLSQAARSYIDQLAMFNPNIGFNPGGPIYGQPGTACITAVSGLSMLVHENVGSWFNGSASQMTIYNGNIGIVLIVNGIQRVEPVAF